MIGTRHEKILIVLASYVIGFTTAFIAFGLSAIEGDVQYAQVSEIRTPKTVSYKEIHNNISEIGANEDGLFVNVGGYERIISSYKSQLQASVIGSTSLAGYPVKHHTPLVSKDGWFAFYCEQESKDVQTCVPYVFNLFDDTVYKVTAGTTASPLQIDSYSVVWSEDNALVLNGQRSASVEKPWLFTEEVKEVDISSEDISMQADGVLTDVENTDIVTDVEPILQ